MALQLRRWRQGECKGYADLGRKYTCDEPVTYKGYCESHIPYEMRRQREYDQTPLEKRQEYLDALKSGLNIGDAYRKVGISFEAALEITNRAITKHEYHTISFEAAA